MIEAYVWLKAFHIVFVVTWFAGIFYLPRLFVYHASADDEVSRERFKVMERKLLRIIMNPSAVLVVLMGAALTVVAWEAVGHCAVVLREAGRGGAAARVSSLLRAYCAGVRRRCADTFGTLLSNLQRDSGTAADHYRHTGGR